MGLLQCGRCHYCNSFTHASCYLILPNEQQKYMHRTQKLVTISNFSYNFGCKRTFSIKKVTCTIFFFFCFSPLVFLRLAPFLLFFSTSSEFSVISQLFRFDYTFDWQHCIRISSMIKNDCFPTCRVNLVFMWVKYLNRSLLFAEFCLCINSENI